MNTRRWLVELCLVVAVFGTAAWWGDNYWNASLQAGRRPIFYQEYFEPAVMMACGHGFVISHPQNATVRAFLYRVTDTFSCSDIPPDAHLGPQDVYQGVWRYLMMATALCWRIRGISWSGLGPLLSVLFAATITFGYGTLRLGMGRLLAIGCAIGLSISSVHLLNLPHLRDYSKAPFTLALIFILGLLVRGRPTRRSLLGCAAAYGLVLGVGYGFRTDFLVNIPVFFVVLFLFVDGGVLKNLALKAGSAALCLAVFLITAFPVISNVYRSGGCQWHTALLGLTVSFSENLQLNNGPYDFGDAYLDGAIYKTSTSYARRVDPRAGDIFYCSHDYDVATGSYLLEIARRFPADMMTRAYASVTQIAELPFGASWLDTPIPGLAPRVYARRLTVLTAFKGSGLAWIIAALVLTSLVSVRLAFFLTFFLFYFGGYPAIQFGNRHYFHLEIITWWAFGFVVHQLTMRAIGRVRGTEAVASVNWRQAAWVMPAIAALVMVPLLVLRVYQQFALRPFFEQYLSAPVDEWPMEAAAPGTLHPAPPPRVSDRITGEAFVVVGLNTSQCADRPAVTFRYDKAFPSDDLSRTFTIERRSLIPEPTYIFTPVYVHFAGVEFSDVRPGCVGSVATVRDVSQMRLLLPSVLSPRWKQEKLYERFKEWPWPSFH